MIARRHRVVESSLKNGKPPVSSCGYYLLTVADTTPTVLDSDYISSTYLFNLVAPKNHPDKSTFVASTGCG
jgi:hypothetical protein